MTTAPGIVATLAVACGVAAFGMAQLFALGQHRTGLAGSGLWRRLGASGMAFDLWDLARFAARDRTPFLPPAG